MTFPGLALLLTVLAFNLVGDGLQDALDPRRRALMAPIWEKRSARCISTKEEQRMSAAVHPLDPVRGACSAALALVSSACGGSDNNSGSSSSGQRTTPTPTQGKKGGNDHRTSPPATSTTSIRARRTTRSATMVQYAMQPAAVLLQARTTRRSRCPDLADGDPQISADDKTDHGQDQARASSSPRRSTARSRPKDIKYAIERAFTENVPSGYAGTYFGVDRGRPRRPTPAATSRSRASRRRTTTTIVFKLNDGVGAAGRRRRW